MTKGFLVYTELSFQNARLFIIALSLAFVLWEYNFFIYKEVPDILSEIHFVELGNPPFIQGESCDNVEIL